MGGGESLWHLWNTNKLTSSVYCLMLLIVSIIFLFFARVESSYSDPNLRSFSKFQACQNLRVQIWILINFERSEIWILVKSRPSKLIKFWFWQILKGENLNLTNFERSKFSIISKLEIVRTLSLSFEYFNRRGKRINTQKQKKVLEKKATFDLLGSTLRKSWIHKSVQRGQNQQI